LPCAGEVAAHRTESWSRVCFLEGPGSLYQLLDVGRPHEPHGGGCHRTLGRNPWLALDPPLGDPASGWFFRSLDLVPFCLEESLSSNWDSPPLFSMLGGLLSSSRAVLRGMRAGISLLLLVGAELSSKGSTSSLMKSVGCVESHTLGVLVEPAVDILEGGYRSCVCCEARVVTEGRWRLRAGLPDRGKAPRPLPSKTTAILGPFTATIFLLRPHSRPHISDRAFYFS